jgi:SAM-dependent methyltransferase
MTAPVALPWCTDADPYADALRTGRGPLFLRRTDGWLLPLEVERWCASADTADMSVLRRCEGAVIDLGCGPGRLVAALASLGHTVLGVDTSPAAVDSTRRAGGEALQRSVFDPLPAEGGWQSALLLDGNIGIGGDPARLLARTRELLAPGGLLLAEAAPTEVDELVEVRLDDGTGVRGPAFPWARLGRTALRHRAEEAGWRAADEWECYGRPFLGLRPAPSGGAVRSSQPARLVREGAARTSTARTPSAHTVTSAVPASARAQFSG